MNLANPAFLAALALLIPVLIAFLVRRHRRVVRVPSTMVWRLGARSVVKNRRFKNLRRLLALFACLLGVAALALAAARPSVGRRGDTTVFVVDVSASMSGAPIREARRWLWREVSSLGANDRVAIVTAGGDSRVALPPTAPGAALDAVIGSLVVEPTSSAIDEAIAIAEGLASGGGARVVVLSDQTIDAESSRLEKRTTARVFSRSERDNVGIVSLYTRAVPESADEDEREVSVSVATSSTMTRRVRVTLTQADTMVADRVLEVPSGAETSQRVSIRGGGRVTAHVEARDGISDAVALDDDASLEQPARRLLRVALVGVAEPAAAVAAGRAEAEDPRRSSAGVGAFFLEKALRASGVAALVRVGADAVPPNDVDVAVVLEDGRGRTRDVPQFLIGAAPPEFGLAPREVGPREARLRSIASDDVLLRGVSLDELTVMRAKTAAAPGGSRVLIDLDGGPALLAGGAGARAWVWLGIDPEESDLVLRVPFPVLVGNVLAHLGGSAGAVAARTLPRSEVTLASREVVRALPTASEPKWRAPVSPPVLLAAVGALLLALEAFFSFRAARRQAV